MLFYILTDGRGSYIRLDPTTGRYVPIRSRKQALEFTDRAKANNVLHSSVEKKFRKDFWVEAITPSEPEPVISNCVSADKTPSTFSPDETFSGIQTNKDTGVLKNIVTNFTVHSEIPDWIEKINAIGDLLFTVPEKISVLSQELSQTQKEITDIEHYIEFTDFNLYQGYLASKMLKQRLQRRRIFKDTLFTLTQIRKSKLDSASITNLKKSIDGLTKRKYQPRILSELFTTNTTKQ